ncbi:MAG: hypothetical protein ACI3YE_08670 [Candidatus Avispirillum sp.]
MKKLSIILALAMLICTLAACGSIEESTRTDTLYAVFSAKDVNEYPIEYTGAQKTAEELADELSELTGLDFIITADKADDGWIVDWSADSSLVTGHDGREQTEDFCFYDYDSMCRFMMDSLWRTLSENLDAENIYYTMDGGQKLVLEKMSPAHEFPSDSPYMGSEFYSAHTDVQGDDEDLYACTKGLWRLDGETDTASIEMDGSGGFTMYYADGSVEADGYLKCIDEFENGSSLRYDMYTDEDEFIAGFYFDSDTRFHIADTGGAAYLLDTRPSYQGFWQYPNGMILEINGDRWNLYAEDGCTLLSDGPMKYAEDAAYLMNEDGSSGGGRAYFDENNNLIESGNILTYCGESLSGGSGDDIPNG